ncbi:MAG TPA: CHAT domain-containing tetratricopeptide repeat protein, partial [Rhizomicrobium sp.]
GEAVARLRVTPLSNALPPDSAGRRDAIMQSTRNLLASGGAGNQLHCGGGAAAGDSVLYFCTLQSNSWPRIVLATASNGSLYEAEGLPSTLPVLEAGIALNNTDRAAADALLKAHYSSDVIKSGSADLGGYDKDVEAARLESGANDFAGAEAHYRRALEINERLFGPDAMPVGETLAELALQVSNQGRFDEADALFRRATPIIEASSSASARARLASYRALNAANQRQFADALKFAREATAARRAEIQANIDADQGTTNGAPALPVNQGELAHSLRIEAEMALRLDELAAAQASAEEALWIISQEPSLPLWWRPDVLMLMGDINTRQGRVVIAERDFHDAVDLDTKLFGDGPPTALAQLRLGRFYTDQQLYPAAIDAYKAAFAILEKDPIARARIVPDQLVPFITAAISSGDPHALDAEVFKASQYAASDIADQTIARVAARQAAGDPALSDLIRQAQDAEHKRDTARIDLAAEYAKSDDDRDANRVKALEASVKSAAAHADELNGKVRDNFPNYTKLAAPGPADLATVEHALGPNEALLSFVIGANGSYGLLVTSHGLAAKPLQATVESLASDVSDLRKAFLPELGQLAPFSLKSSYALYSELVQPFSAELGGVTHLVVAPSGDLASLPLSLLVTSPPPDGSNYVNAAWLIRQMAVSQVPSPRAFLALRDAGAKRAAPKRPFLGIGDPAFQGSQGLAGVKALDSLAQDCRQSGPISPELLRALSPLPDTRREIQIVGAAMGASQDTMLLGADATETNFRNEPLDQFGVIYFATHGLLPGELHCQSEPGLVLSPPAQAASSLDGDGLLSASEIAGLKLNADLVVLSACNTAAAGGTKFGGGALEGLADSFFDAGARAVLASHWEVPSTATEKLMTGLFAGDRRGGLAEALRQSQLSLIASPATAHPFYWAAFTLIGDGAATGTGSRLADGAP